MKYPLTPEAKEAAAYLVECWNSGQIEQRLRVIIRRGGDVETVGHVFGAKRDLKPPMLAQWKELARYGLIELNEPDWDVLLLQELRNAVETDFEVSEYFLTMNAVGTIVQGNLTMHPGSAMQSAGVNTGSMHQTVEQVANDLAHVLGPAILESNTALLTAINELRQSNEASRPSKAAEVASLLSEGLQNAANAASFAAALVTLVPLLQQVFVR